MQAYLLAALAAGLFGFAWWIPGTAGSAVLGWLATFALIALVRRFPVYRTAYVAGVLLYIIGFYWLFGTIADFGGFPPVAAAGVFGLFVAVSALQLVAFLFIFKNLPGTLEPCALRTATAWIVAEFFFFRIFPWAWGHTQLAFVPLAQVADIAGVPLVSWLLFWCSEASYRWCIERERNRRLAIPWCIFIAAIGYGAWRSEEFRDPTGAAQDVALVQANLTIREKGNLKYFTTNLQRYKELTETVIRPGLLVVWPESIFIDFVSTDIGSVKNDPRLPFWDKGAALLIGALTFSSRTEYYNSALAILPDGSIPKPYHKQILMPFGEYTPLAGVFPWLKEINATAGEFTAGKDITVFQFPGAEPGTTAGVSPLICYEDVVPGLSRAAVRAGAHLLVNVTNDAWFGDTAAPHQHHLIAAWRAIENRRFLIRSTNSGLTAVVNARGETIAALPTFSEGVLETTVKLLDAPTLYAGPVGDLPWWVISLAALFGVARNATRRRRNAQPPL